MPTYTLKHKKNGKMKSEFMTVSEMAQWEKDNPNWEVMCGAPIIGYNVYTVKPTGHLKEQIAEIRKKIPGNNLHKYET